MMETNESQVRQYWQRHAGAFESVYTGHKSPVGRWLDRTLRKDMFVRYGLTFDHAGPLEGRRILDIGCGPGHYSVEFASRGAARIVGVDVAAEMLELARRSAEARGVSDRCEFVLSGIDAFQPAEPFDVSVAMGFFDYVQDAVPPLRKIRGYTRDRLLATFPERTLRAPLRKARLALLGCPVYFYSRKDLEAIFHEAGWSRLEIIYTGQIHFVKAIP